jgi:hypothetical protein
VHALVQRRRLQPPVLRQLHEDMHRKRLHGVACLTAYRWSSRRSLAVVVASGAAGLRASARARARVVRSAGSIRSKSEGRAPSPSRRFPVAVKIKPPGSSVLRNVLLTTSPFSNTGMRLARAIMRRPRKVVSYATR